MGKLVNGIIAAIATLFIMAGISMPALAATDDTYVPKNDSAGNIFVQDQANVLSAETEKHVYDLNKSWESREDKPQLLVVTVSTLDGVPIERKAKELFDRYKPGMKGKNTGLVYLLSIKDHKDRLTVGTGIGQTFNQSTCESIINSGHANYKKSYWNAGISKVLDNIASTVQRHARDFIRINVGYNPRTNAGMDRGSRRGDCCGRLGALADMGIAVR